MGTKEKNSAKIAVGETVTYNIEEKEFNGRKSYNIRLTAPAPTSFSKGGGGYSNPGNQQEIRKSVALNNAVQFWKDQKGAKTQDLLSTAEVFLKWLEGAVQVQGGGIEDEQETPF